MRLPIAVAVIALTLGVASPAAADGVPVEVSQYVSGGLIDDLNEFYGPGQDGAGLLFTNSTTTGSAVRVFGFTPGADVDPPVRRLNRWVSVIAIDEKVVGLATLSIEPRSNTPQLDLYLASPELGTVVAALPDTAQLVSDPDREAWFSLDGTTLTPLVAGTSGVTLPTTVAAYRTTLTTGDAAPTPAGPPRALIAVGLVLAGLVALLAVERFLPFWRRRPVPEVEPDETPAAAIAPEPVAKPRVPRIRPPASR